MNDAAAAHACLVSRAASYPYPCVTHHARLTAPAAGRRRRCRCRRSVARCCRRRTASKSQRTTTASVASSPSSCAVFRWRWPRSTPSRFENLARIMRMMSSGHWDSSGGLAERVAPINETKAHSAPHPASGISATLISRPLLLFISLFTRSTQGRHAAVLCVILQPCRSLIVAATTWCLTLYAPCDVPGAAAG
jgi:hypothetical protein